MLPTYSKQFQDEWEENMQKDIEKQNKMIDDWNKLQEENEERYHSPHSDVKSIVIALGWGLLWMGVGILIGILILI